MPRPGLGGDGRAIIEPGEATMVVVDGAGSTTTDDEDVIIVTVQPGDSRT